MDMIDPKLIVFAFCTALSIAFFVYRHIRFSKINKCEPRITDEELRALLPNEPSGEIAIRLRRILVDFVPVKEERIHPDKSIVAFYGLGDIDGLDVDEFVNAVEAEFGCKLDDLGLQQARTLRDIAMLLDL